MNYASEQTFERYVQRCQTREALLSDKTYLMVVVGDLGAPAWRIERALQEKVLPPASHRYQEGPSQPSHDPPAFLPRMHRPSLKKCEIAEKGMT